MGFLDYAWSLSLQKDNMKTGIRIDQKLKQPILTHDKAGFNVTLPLPIISENEETEEKTTSFLGYIFPTDDMGKARVGRLFRACVYHLTTHTLMPVTERMTISKRRTTLDRFTDSLVNDTYVNAYLGAWYPDKLADIAYANSLAYTKIKPVETIFSPATRIMTALLSKINMGTVKGTLQPEEEETVNQLTEKVGALKEETMLADRLTDTQTPPMCSRLVIILGFVKFLLLA